jgi:uncharacterized membrane protein YphA (DoxX/SURF4 family)
MRFKDRLALDVAPLFLRLVLAATFIWAGAGKLTEMDTVDGDDAALLANAGVIPGIAPSPAPEPAPAAQPTPPPAGGSASAGIPEIVFALQASGPIQVRRLHTSVTLRVLKAAAPGTTAGGQPRDAFWPTWAVQGQYAAWTGWAVALSELIGGAFVLFGFFTRIGALSMAGAMAGALWLTQFGPAIASHQAVLGFLPSHAPFDTAVWTPMLWQLSLLGASLSLLFTGSGTLAIDRVIFAGSSPTAGQ